MSSDAHPAALDHKAKRQLPSGQRPLVALRTTGRSPVPLPEVRLIPIASIRTDGGAQHRIAPDPNIIKEYAEGMRAGIEFPPISVRFDGSDYWPSDGFQRLAAAALADLSDITAEVTRGTKEAAQWDSYAANATHGLRRTPAETEEVVKKALEHPNAAKLSNVQMAKHLHIPLATLQRYRERLILLSGQDSSTRTVTRGGSTYKMRVTNLGRKKGGPRTKPRRNQQAEIEEARQTASEPAQAMFNVLEKWVRHQLSPERLRELVEGKLCKGRGDCPFR
jgi:hypothetical protein